MIKFRGKKVNVKTFAKKVISSFVEMAEYEWDEIGAVDREEITEEEWDEIEGELSKQVKVAKKKLKR